ncbi:tyrosyl-dna phosphodiesterase 1 [Phtheirospermum japonicum]|uniref:Tyrosyl-dna phosphodiesterase 1 n=1 Tax=Phtheirospermum japonicum TaxID=374723 RepID=A0A830BKS5_9LAMI|nr:tyrosyl-dna phosphodiesterase 1 [Phtheirospermum japonicum]
MNNSADSAFSFQNRKRRQQFKIPTLPFKKPKKITVKEAILNVRALGLPLLSSSTDKFCESLRLEPYKPYTVGRKSKLCDFIFSDRRVSKRHCQLYFDSSKKRVYLSDGLFLGYIRCNDSFTNFRAKASTNGAFVNGVKVSGVVELQVGDLVSLVCGNEGACEPGASIGFLVEKAVFVEEVDYRSLSQLSKQASFTLRRSRVLDNTSVYLNWCRNMLCSNDPISYIRKCNVPNWKKEIDISSGNVSKNLSDLFLDSGFGFCSNSGLQIGCHKRKRVYSREFEAVEPEKEIIVISEESTETKSSNDVAAANADTLKHTDFDFIDIENTDVANYNPTDYSQFRELIDDENCGGCVLPPGNKFYLNRLEFGSQEIAGKDDVVSLPELFHPIESLIRVFIATFTSDILWFLNYCKIPYHLPVTIACHSTERCWSSDPNKRTSVPFPDFPNLTVVYPPFPEAIAFNNDRKNLGIGCHHPKLFVLQREDRLRVVITSANLVEKQWHRITNTVWWQDFPRSSIPNCLSLFSQLSLGEINIDSKCDFAAQLAGFMSSLVADVPSQAHWILELIKYDFKGAAGYLVTSVPGIYTERSQYVYESKNRLVGNNHKLESCGANFLSSVEASVVGTSHIYRVSTDYNGEHLKKLALFLEKCHENMDGMSEVVLRRDTNIPADGNAVSVLIPNPEDVSVGDFVQLGFLPRDIAKWVAPLSDMGLFAFSAYIHPKEILATALEGSSKKVKLILYVYSGPSFSTISEVTQLEHVSAICSLVALSQRYAGLWRLKEVLCQYKWPEHLESEFFFGSSSVGSVNAQFLAAFSAAAGKKSVLFSDSEESDPEWGCWSASQELKNPSISIIFPSIERVKSNRSGIMDSRFLLCFSQKTWQRLEKVGILHDAIPYPSDRVGFPMHVKVGRRRFMSKKDGSSFGWVYSGSHNFSAAAWGRPISDRQSNGNARINSVLGSRLHISNYELGIVFVVPPPDAVGRVEQYNRNLDDIVLPFVVPPPKYRRADKPATAQAIREALKEERELNEAILACSAAGDDFTEDEIVEQEEEEVLETAQYVTQEKEDEKAYADKLWSQVDCSESC